MPSQWVPLLWFPHYIRLSLSWIETDSCILVKMLCIHFYVLCLYNYPLYVVCVCVWKCIRKIRTEVVIKNEIKKIIEKTTKSKFARKHIVYLLVKNSLNVLTFERVFFLFFLTTTFFLRWLIKKLIKLVIN